MLPWIVGVTVKLYLDAQGKPTIPWSYFVSGGGLILLIPVSIWWAFPFIALAFAGRSLLRKPFWGLELYSARILFMSGGLIGGCIGAVRSFTDIFWEFDPVYLIVPIWLFYIPHMLIGLLLGFVVATVFEKHFSKRFQH
jgi:hypothetical protein